MLTRVMFTFIALCTYLGTIQRRIATGKHHHEIHYFKTVRKEAAAASGSKKSAGSKHPSKG